MKNHPAAPKAENAIKREIDRVELDVRWRAAARHDRHGCPRAAAARPARGPAGGTSGRPGLRRPAAEDRPITAKTTGQPVSLSACVRRTFSSGQALSSASSARPEDRPVMNATGCSAHPGQHPFMLRIIFCMPPWRTASSSLRLLGIGLSRRFTSCTETLAPAAMRGFLEALQQFRLACSAGVIELMIPRCA